VGTKAKYLLKKHPLVETEDLIKLPWQLQKDYYSIIEKILQIDPYNGGKLFNTHILKGNLRGYRALEIDNYNFENTFRLVYKIYEKPAPKRVEILSIGEHDPAYDQAIERLKK